jgi:hypothetical protein
LISGLGFYRFFGESQVSGVSGSHAYAGIQADDFTVKHLIFHDMTDEFGIFLGPTKALGR